MVCVQYVSCVCMCGMFDVSGVAFRCAVSVACVCGMLGVYGVCVCVVYVRSVVCACVVCMGFVCV